jgi:putative membrane protein
MSPLLPSLASAIHLLSLAAGVAILFLRRQALLATLDDAGIRRVLRLDNISAVVAIAWMGSGVWRAFGGLEKGTEYYTSNWVFWLKLGLLGVAWGFEWKCMLTFIRWRTQLAKHEAIDVSVAPSLVSRHYPEIAMIGVLTFVAAFMAHGAGQAATAGMTPHVARGEAVYTSNCMPCHGLDGRGRNGTLAADFVGDARRLSRSDDVLLASIRKGVPGTAMVGFEGRLEPDDQRAALAYIRFKYAPPAAP